MYLFTCVCGGVGACTRGENTHAHGEDVGSLESGVKGIWGWADLCECWTPSSGSYDCTASFITDNLSVQPQKENFLKQFIYFYFMCINVLPSGLSV